MSARWFGVALGVALFPAALGTAVAADAPAAIPQVVGFVDDSPLKVTFDSGTTTKKETILIANGGPKVTATLNALVLDNGIVAPNTILKVTVEGAAQEGFTLEQERVTTLIVTFDRPLDKRTLSGWLVLEGGGFSPSVRELSTQVADWPYDIGPVQGVIQNRSLPIGPATIPIVAIVLAAGLTLLSLVGLSRKPSVGRAKWSFSDSWASTLTAAGAILGTAVGTTLLPDEPIILGKSTYIVLNLLFGFLVLLAPLVFESLRGTSGTVGTQAFLIAATITLIAVLGELMTILVFAMDISPAAGSNGLRGILIVAAVIGIVAVLVYAYRKIRAIAGAKTGRNSKAISEEEVEVEWSLL
jgi:hypothetical protein